MLLRAFLRWDKSKHLSVFGLGLVAAGAEAGFILLLRNLASGLSAVSDNHVGDRWQFIGLGILFGLVIIRVFAHVIQVNKSVALTSRWVAVQRKRLLRLTVEHSYPVYRDPGQFKKQVGENLEIVKQGLLSGYRCLFAGMQLICFFPLLVLFPWQLSFTVLLLLAPVAFISRFRIASLRRYSDNQYTALGAMRHALDYHAERLEFYSGNRLLPLTHGRLSSVLTEKEKTLDKWETVQAVFPQLMETFFFLMIGSVTVLLVLADFMGSIRTEDMLPFLILLLLMYKPVREWARQFPNIVSGTRAWRSFIKYGESISGAKPVVFIRRNTGNLQVREVKFGYFRTGGRNALLRDLSFTLAPDKITVIYGPNGAGKSTLLKLLLNLETPQAGEIEYPNQWMKNGTPALAYLPQAFRMDRGLLAHLATFAFQRPSDWACIKEALKISFLDSGFVERWRDKDQGPFSDWVDNGVGEPVFSNGQTQRLGLAWVFSTPAHFLLLDEPTAWLPATNRGVMLKRLFDMRRSRLGSTGLGGLIISHEREVISLADTVYKLDAGCLRREVNS